MLQLQLQCPDAGSKRHNVVLTAAGGATVLGKVIPPGDMPPYLYVTLAHQYLGQVEKGTLQAVLGNVGTFLSFRVGAEDAEVVARQLSDAHVTLQPENVMSLPQYYAYVRLLIDGMPSRPFSMKTLKPAPLRSPVRGQRVRQASRRRDARPLEVVEAQIAKALPCA